MMKKLFMLIAVVGVLTLGMSNNAVAQDQSKATTEEVASADSAAVAAVPVDVEENTAAKAEKGQSLHSAIKQKFIEGGPGFMTAILLCLILGLAFSLERIIYLNLATTNNKKLLSEVEEALKSGGIDAAKEICRNTRGPVASIFYQGLDRSGEGMEVVEKTVTSYGGIQANLMEKGLSWIGLFIALGPMLGFMGTVIGMIQAFDSIEMAGDISPTLVAAGIKVALITTVSGLVVGIVLQVFYNYCLAKIDSVVTSMEDASISLNDMLVKYQTSNK